MVGYCGVGGSCIAQELRPEAIKYYTARVTGRVDSEAPKRQHAYLRALQHSSKVEIIYGKFYAGKAWAGLSKPLDFRPKLVQLFNPEPDVAYVWKTEEKGSDVNLGVHLVRDAFQKKFDLAAVLTNDTDLVEPVRIVTQEIGLPVTLLSPCSQSAISLKDVSTNVRHIKPYLGPCQLPLVIQVPGKDPIKKPVDW